MHEEKGDDHTDRRFWIYALPLASKKAAEVLVSIQTIVGQLNSELQGDDTKLIRLGAVSRIHGDSVWEISGGKVRVWARSKGFKVIINFKRRSIQQCLVLKAVVGI